MKKGQVENAIYYLETLLNISSDAVTIIDSTGKVQYWNTRAEQIYDISLDSIKNKNIFDFFKKDDLKLLEILESKKPVYNVEHQPRPDKFVLISSSPIFDENGTIIGAVSIDQDITNIVKLNEKLDSTTTQLQKIKQQIHLKDEFGPFSGIIGSSPSIDRAKKLAQKVAKTDATVLITGESGVGKELFAQGIHEASLRNKQAFVPINCGAIPEALFESEFFGYEKGAFTGAYKDGKVGKIEIADGGTLFLDEIGLLPLDMQAKLLRVLQEKEVSRIGGNYAKKVDVRIIAATNNNLVEMVEKGEFRYDLYYRINVVELLVPSLRDRGEDIMAMVENFINEYSVKYHREKPTLLDSTIEMFRGYDWPGNVRQLRNTMERVMILSDKQQISSEDIVEIFPSIPFKVINKEGLAQEKALLEKERIREALTKTNGNKSAAAELLGISRVSLYKKIKEYGI